LASNKGQRKQLTQLTLAVASLAEVGRQLGLGKEFFTAWLGIVAAVFGLIDKSTFVATRLVSPSDEN
jgi:hypothetical protein